MRSPLARDAQPSLEENERRDAAPAPSDQPVWLRPPLMSTAPSSAASSDFTARVMARIQTESHPEAICARPNARAAEARGRCRRGSRLRVGMVALVVTFGPALLLAVLFPGVAFAAAGALLALLLSALVVTRAVAYTLNQVATNPAALLGLALGCGATAFGCAYHARHVYRLPRKR